MLGDYRLRQMKVLLVILHADRSRGGAERYTLDLHRALRDRRIDSVLAAAGFVGLPPSQHHRGLLCPGATRTGRYRSFVRSLDALLAREPFDLVHAMLPVPRCDLYHPHAGIAVEAVVNSPVQSWLNPRRRVFADVERSLLARPDPPVVLCLSNYIKSAVRAHHTIAEDRLVRLFNAVDLERFTPGARSFEVPGLKLLMVAQDFARKGLREALLAMARLRRLDVMLTVVGGDNPRFYRRLASRLGIDGQVRFIGSASDVRPFYADADALLLPTRHDPCSLVVLEALATGLPVISTRFNGACEIMTDGVHGRVLDDPADIAALADAIEQLSDPTTRRKMSDACLALRPMLSWEHHVDSLVGVYHEELARRRPVA
jgi:UDP-glucose:(heptosyl)LPS alpha-1,3-glucosyltransferase